MCGGRCAAAAAAARGAVSDGFYVLEFADDSSPGKKQTLPK
jgi:hypothetical protein